jgi:hypothetical protein
MKHVDRIDGLELTSYLPTVAEPARHWRREGVPRSCVARERTADSPIAIARTGFPWSESVPVDR